jgi:hypothetical protein
MNQNRNFNHKAYDIIDEMQTPPTSKTMKNEFSIKNGSKLIASMKDQENRNPISVLDTNLRIKELEKRFWEFKEKLERKVTNLNENAPMNFLSNMKVMEEQSIYHWKESKEKQAFLENKLEIISNGVSSKFEHMLDMLKDMRLNIEDVKNKNDKTKADFNDRLNDISNNDIQIPFGRNGTGNMMNMRSDQNEFLANELSYVKNRMIELENKRSDERIEWERKNCDLYERLSSTEAEYTKMLFKQRDEILTEFKRNLDGVRTNFGGMKVDRNMIDINEKLNIFEGKLLRGNSKNQELKEYLSLYVDRRLNEFASELKDELDAVREKNKSLSEEMHDGLRALTSGNTSMKFSISSEIESFKKSVDDRTKYIQNSLNGFTTKLKEKISNIELDTELNKKETGLLRTKLYTNINEIEKKLHDEIMKFDSILSNTTTNYAQTNERISENLKKMEDEQNQWKVNLETTNQEALGDINRIIHSFKTKILDLKNAFHHSTAENKDEMANLQNLIELKDKNFIDKIQNVENLTSIKYETVSQNIADMFELEKKFLANSFAELIKESEKSLIARMNGEIEDKSQQLTQSFKFTLGSVSDKFGAQIKDTNNTLYEQLKETKLMLKNILKAKFNKMGSSVKDIATEIITIKANANDLRVEIEGNIERVNKVIERVDSSLNEKNKSLESTLKSEIASTIDRLRNTFEGSLISLDSKLLTLRKDYEGLNLKIANETENRLMSFEREVRTSINEAQHHLEAQNAIAKTRLENDLILMKEYISELDATTRALMEASTMQEKAERVKNDKLVLMIIDQKLKHLESYFKDSIANNITKVETALQALSDHCDNELSTLDVKIQETNAALQDNVRQINSDIEYEKLAQSVLMQKMQDDFKDFENVASQQFEAVNNQLKEGQKNSEDAIALITTSIERKASELDQKMNTINDKLTENLAENFRELENKLKEQSQDHDQQLQENVKELTERLDRVDKNFEEQTDKFGNTVDKIYESLDKIEVELEVLDGDLVKKIAEVLKKIDALDESQKNRISKLVEKLEKRFEKVTIDMESSNYLSNLYVSAIESQIAFKFEKNDEELLELNKAIEACKGELSSLSTSGQSSNTNLFNEIEKTNKNLKLLQKEHGQLEQNFEAGAKSFTKLETKIDKNFKLAEESLLKINHYINIIDSRLTTEELMTRATFGNMSEQMSQQVDIIANEIDKISVSILTTIEPKLNETSSKASNDLVDVEQKLKRMLEIKASEIEGNFSTKLDDKASDLEERFDKKLSDQREEIETEISDEIQKKIEEAVASFDKKLETEILTTKEFLMNEIAEEVGLIHEEMALNTEDIKEIVKFDARIGDEINDTNAAVLMESLLRKANEDNVTEKINELVGVLQDN